MTNSIHVCAWFNTGTLLYTFVGWSKLY